MEPVRPDGSGKLSNFGEGTLLSAIATITSLPPKIKYNRFSDEQQYTQFYTNIANLLWASSLDCFGVGQPRTIVTQYLQRPKHC